MNSRRRRQMLMCPFRRHGGATRGEDSMARACGPYPPGYLPGPGPAGKGAGWFVRRGPHARP
jgi:hypothetical protein